MTLATARPALDRPSQQSNDARMQLPERLTARQRLAERFIESLIKKYQTASGFPFLNWASDPVSFYALTNLWDDLFQAASGKNFAAFEATLDAKMDPDSPIYDVTARALGRRVLVSPEPEGGTFHFIARDANPDEPFRSELGFSMDLAPERLASAFEIIRAYMSTDIENRADLKALEDVCIEQHAHRFGFTDYDPFASRRAARKS